MINWELIDGAASERNVDNTGTNLGATEHEPGYL